MGLITAEPLSGGQKTDCNGHSIMLLQDVNRADKAFYPMACTMDKNNDMIRLRIIFQRLI